MLDNAQTHYFNEGMMRQVLPEDVCDRFQDALKTGAPTSEADQKAIADAMLKWARSLGATSFSHWFFPLRFGSGAVGGMLGGMKYDAFIDKVWSNKSANKPFEEAFPAERLFVGETDGSSIHEKTPLLRSSDAIQREGLRLLKNMGKDSEA